MRLTKFSYKSANWELKDLEFGAASLIVGRNAVGKTRTLGIFNLFFAMLKRLPVTRIDPANFFCSLITEKGETLNYFCSLNIVENQLVIEETLDLNGKSLLVRKADQPVVIFNVADERMETISPPENSFIIHVSRDTRKYPYLEELYAWADRSVSFRFGAITADLSESFYFHTPLRERLNIRKMVEALTQDNREKLRSNLRCVGFRVDAIDTKAEDNALSGLMIHEAGIPGELSARELSQGMLRTVYLLVFLQYVIQTAEASFILIDDLCEGLDYERATKLGKLVFEVCEENKLQLIATSNDMFLMDVIDLSHWNILQRDGGVVTALNAKNHPKLFEDFKFTGLSNFDFFSSDYIHQKLQ